MAFMKDYCPTWSQLFNFGQYKSAGNIDGEILNLYPNVRLYNIQSEELNLVLSAPINEYLGFYVFRNGMGATSRIHSNEVTFHNLSGGDSNTLDLPGEGYSLILISILDSNQTFVTNLGYIASTPM